MNTTGVNLNTIVSMVFIRVQNSTIHGVKNYTASANHFNNAPLVLIYTTSRVDSKLSWCSINTTGIITALNVLVTLSLVKITPQVWVKNNTAGANITPPF